jgi:hypothetical protein
MKNRLFKAITLLCIIATFQNLFLGFYSFTETSDQSSQIKIKLAIPEISYAIASTTSVSLTWVTVDDAAGYDLEADGSLISDIQTPSYTHSGLAPNTKHEYRVRAKNAEATGEWGSKISISTSSAEVQQIKLQMYNSKRQDTTNSISPFFKLINTGAVPLKLSDVKVRYYYKVEGIETQKFWCDWSNIGAENVTGSFIRLADPKEGADYCLELGFSGNAGSLQPDQSAEIQIRFSNTEWSNYTQTNDYSYNGTSNKYADWNKATVYIKDALLWGEEPSVSVPAPDKLTAGLQMYNSKRQDTSNSVSPFFKLTNTGTVPIKLSEAKIRYYYKLEGIESQKFWCDWSSIGANNVTGSFMRLPDPKEGADYCLEIGFSENAGSLQPGQSAEIQARFSNTDWSDYTQTNDYSYNSSANQYTDWKKATVYIKESIVWGEEPSVEAPVPNESAARLQMYNQKTQNTTNTVFVRYKLYNTGSKPINLNDIRIRYYYTIDGNVNQNFWCDWTPIGNQNVTGKFYKMSAPIENADYCFEMGFKESGGQLLPWGNLEIQSRFAKTNWSNYSQANDYSYNDVSNNYIDWNKATVYIGDIVVWGDEIMLEVPANIAASGSETETTLSWNTVPGAIGYDVEADGIKIDAGGSTSYTNSNLSPGTLHKYRVRAKSNITAGLWSDVIEKWTLPAIPGNIVVSSENNSIIVTWDEVAGATGYDIEVYGTTIDNGSKTSYKHTGLNPNIQQTYRVRAKNSSGVGKWSAIAAGTTLPGIPANLNASATEDSTLLKWDSVSGASSYDIEADGVIIPDVTANLYKHAGLIPNTIHKYRVRAKNSFGAGNWSQLLSFITLLPVPSNIVINIKSTETTLKWDKVDLAASYDIEVDGVVKNGGSETAFTHEELKPGTSHTYRVRSVSESNKSAWSEEKSAVTLSEIPINIIATASKDEIKITWDPITDVEGYDIEVDGNVIDNGTKTTYIHTGLTANSTHTYRVRARNSAGAGEWSKMITVSTSITAPDGFKASATSTTVTLNWNTVTGATGYDLLTDGTVVDMGTKTSYIHKGLEPNSVHVYRVRSRKGEGASAWSNAIVQNTRAGIPSGLKAISKTNEITVMWNKVDGAAVYELEADGEIKEVGDKNSYIHTGLKLGISHSYRARAGNSNGMGDWSETITTKTAPPAPQNLKAEATTNQITLKWDTCINALSYEVEVNGVAVKDIKDAEYIHSGLEPNTMQAYRVRALYEDGVSVWSEILKASTKPELILKIAENTTFNFVVVVPFKKDADTRRIRVEYNPDELEVIDLCANTPEIEKEAGAINGTNISVSEFVPGKIVYEIKGANKTVVDMIRFLSKTNDNSRVRYAIE